MLHQEVPEPVGLPALPARQGSSPAIDEEAWQTASDTPVPGIDSASG